LVFTLKTLIIIWLASLTGSGFSQTTDTLFQERESQPEVSRQAVRPSREFYLLPVGGIIYGILAQDAKLLKRFDRDLKLDIQEDYPHFQTHIDNQLQYVPAVTVYALDLLGVKGKNTVVDKTAMYLISNTLTGIAVGTLKTQTGRARPDGSDKRSFPSGHTAAAFAAAEFMNQEYKDLSPWYGIAGYTAATATGTLRMLNNKHWLSDVIMGAGVGVLTTKLVYTAYPAIKSKLFANKPSKVVIVPFYDRGFYRLALTAPLD
jgi:hypothetical protein